MDYQTLLLDEHDVKVVISGLAARDLFERGERFDVILCDLMLEDLSGMELSRWLQDERPDLAERVVFMTGGAFTEEARAFLGLPDIQPMQEALVAQMQERLAQYLAATEPEALMRLWLPGGIKGLAQLQEQFWKQMMAMQEPARKPKG